MRAKAPLFLGSTILLALLTLAVAAPRIAPHDPAAQNLGADLLPRSEQHPLGTDRLGRDVLSRIVHGARVSMLVGFSTVLVSAAIGVAVGFLAAYRRGWVDETLMRLVDVLMAFPGVLLAIAFVAVLGPGLDHVILALCLIGWTGYARLVRGQVLSLREREFVTAARALGAGSGRILAAHVLPNLAAPLLIQCTFGMAGAIVAEGALSFLGLGVTPPTASWGAMLNEGRQFLLVAPHLTTFPGLAILITVLALNWIGDGLREIFDRK